MTTVRLRGIYATALSALLPRHGFAVVEASPVMAERLGLPMEGPAEISLRDRPDHQAVWIEGPREPAEALARSLQAVLPDAAARYLEDATLWEVELPAGSKSALDAERASVWPTVAGHHLLKIVEQSGVEAVEARLTGGLDVRQGDALRSVLVHRAMEAGRVIQTEHVKPDGRTILMRGQVSWSERGRLLLRRSFRPGGTYDSLSALKREGDFGLTEHLEGSWVTRRRYLRANRAAIGELYNVQTPTELYPDRVRYLDLEVDVAAWPGGRVEIVDRAELAEARSAGYISAALADRALQVAEEIAATLQRGETPALERWL